MDTNGEEDGRGGGRELLTKLIHMVVQCTRLSVKKKS